MSILAEFRSGFKGLCVNPELEAQMSWMLTTTAYRVLSRRDFS